MSESTGTWIWSSELGSYVYAVTPQQIALGGGNPQAEADFWAMAMDVLSQHRRQGEGRPQIAA